MTTMIRYSFWLRFDRFGGYPKSSKNIPALRPDERAMRCTVEIPKSVFVRPQLTAHIKVDEIDADIPHIDVEAAENALADVLGVDVVFNVKELETEYPVDNPND